MTTVLAFLLTGDTFRLPTVLATLAAFIASVTTYRLPPVPLLAPFPAVAARLRVGGWSIPLGVCHPDRPSRSGYCDGTVIGLRAGWRTRWRRRLYRVHLGQVTLAAVLVNQVVLWRGWEDVNRVTSPVAWTLIVLTILAFCDLVYWERVHNPVPPRVHRLLRRTRVPRPFTRGGGDARP